MRRAALAGAATLATLACSPATAQIAPDAQVPTLTPQRQIRVNVESSGQYHSNIAHTDEPTAVKRGLELEDWVLRPALRFNLYQPIGRNGLYASGNVGYQFHRNNSQLDAGIADVTGGAAATVNICQAVIFGGYTARQSDLGDITAVVAKNFEERRRVGTTLQCGRGRGFRAVMSATRTWTDNSAKLIQEANSTTDTLDSIASYQNAGLGTVQLIGSFLETSLPNRITGPAPTDPIGDLLMVYTAGVGYEKKLGSKLRLSGQASRSYVKRKAVIAGVDRSTSSTTYSGDITYKVTPRIELEIKADRAVVPSGTVGRLYDTNTNSEAIVRYRLGTRIETTAGVRRIDSVSEVDGSVVFASFTKARTDSVYASASYRFRRGGSIALEVRQDERDTDKPAFNYLDNTVRLFTSASF